MSDTLTAKRRETTGSRASMKLRAEGFVPAVLYGHNEKPVSLALSTAQIRKSLAHKAKVVNLSGDAGEKVNVTVPVELKGEAVGAVEGGVVTLVIDHLEIEAAPASIPEVLHIDITNLHLGDNMTAGQITDLPSGATLVTPADAVVVQCVPPAGAGKLDDDEESADTPEVIGKSGEDKAEGDE